MGITTYPLNGKQYDARDAETYLCTRTSGVYSEEILFTPNGMNIIITPFHAWIKNDDFSGKSVAVTTETVLTISPSEPIRPRIDRIVLRFDSAKNDSELIVLKGTHASVPTPPPIERTPIKYDLCLCEVYVKPSATSISAADITNTLLDESLCGLMRDGVTHIPTAQLHFQTDALLKDLARSISMAQNGSPVLQSLGIKCGTVDVTIGEKGQTIYKSNTTPFDVAFLSQPIVIVTRKISALENNAFKYIKPQESVVASAIDFYLNVFSETDLPSPHKLTYNWVAIGKVDWSNIDGGNGGGNDEGEGGGNEDGGGEVEDPYYNDMISGGTLFISNRPTTTSIALNAYIGRSDFGRLVIPNNIKTINNSAFKNCTALQSIEIGSGVTDVNDTVFEGCTALRYIYVDNANSEIKSVDDVLLSANGVKLLLYAKAKTETEYIIPNTVRTIYPKAFENCDNLTYVVIPSGVAAIQESTFKDSQNLSRISIPASVTIISNNAFSGCLSLSDVYYSGTKSQWEDVIIGSGNDYLKNAVIHCTDGDINGEEESPIYYNIYASVSPEGSGTVEGAGSYESGTLVTLRATANEGYIFSYWARGTEHRATSEITVEATENQSWVAYFIEGEEDTGKVNITVTVEPEGSGTITGGGQVDSGAFTTIQATPNSGYRFKHWRFESGSTNANNPYLFKPTEDRNIVAVFEVGSDEEETTYTKDTIVDGVLYVGTEETGIETDNKYSANVSLTEVIIPEGRTRIALGVFSGCYNLAKVTMPSTMSSIVDLAFDSCSNLTEITYNGTKAQWNNVSKDNAFYNLSNLTVHCTDGDVNYQKIEFYITPENAGSITTSPKPVTATTEDIFLVVGGSMTYTATPNSGYRFKEWTYGGLNTWTDNPVTLPRDGVTQPPVMNAVFEADTSEKKQITFDSAVGSVDISYDGKFLKTVTNDSYTDTFDIGKEITIEYKPNQGDTFAFWSDLDKAMSGDSNYIFGYDNPLTFTVNESCPAKIGVSYNDD